MSRWSFPLNEKWKCLASVNQVSGRLGQFDPKFKCRVACRKKGAASPRICITNWVGVQLLQIQSCAPRTTYPNNRVPAVNKGTVTRNQIEHIFELERVGHSRTWNRLMLLQLRGIKIGHLYHFPLKEAKCRPRKMLRGQKSWHHFGLRSFEGRTDQAKTFNLHRMKLIGLINWFQRLSSSRARAINFKMISPSTYNDNTIEEGWIAQV